MKKQKRKTESKLPTWLIKARKNYDNYKEQSLE
jgi:hypothetical protein